MGNIRNTRWVTMDKGDTDLSLLKKHFEIHNRTEGKSPRTVGWYNEVLGLFYAWLEGEGLSTALGDIDEMVVRQFILYLQSRPGTKGKTLSSHSMYNRVNALKSFFNWVHKMGYTEEHVLKGLRQPKRSELLIEPLTPEEIAKVYAAVNTKAALGARNTAIISLMLDTGVRLSEVAGLKAHDVHLEMQYVKVMGKGSKERIVSFGASCLKTLLHYYFHFGGQQTNQDADTFFLTIDGYPMSSSAVRSVVKRLAKASGILRLHPHLLRHTYATMFLLNGGDVFLLKQNLGHTTLSMVQQYIHIVAQTAAVRSQGFSPLDRMNLGDDRRFSHKFRKGDILDGHVYPNAGAKRKKKRSR